MKEYGVVSTVLVLSLFSLLPHHSHARYPHNQKKPEAPSCCCYGKEEFKDGEVVDSLANCCLQLVCQDGEITKRFHNQMGDHGCCEYEGEMYAEGTELPGFCWKLVCKEGEWTFTGCIDDCCGHCYVHTDPHFGTFDNHHYDFHDSCNYSLTQTDSSHDPDTAVYSDFEPCFGGASCLDKSTFKDNPNTIINLHAGTVFTLGVNGNSFVVPASGVHQVIISSCNIAHPVLVFRYHGCVVLLGSSRLVVMHCPYRLDIWAHPSFTDGLDGLCGHYNSFLRDDLKDRSGRVHPLELRPTLFPYSWKTEDQTDEQCQKPCEPGDKGCTSNLQNLPPDACVSGTTDYNLALGYCQANLSTTDNYLLSTCAHDVCVMRRNGNTVLAVEAWFKTLEMNVLMTSRLNNATICPGDTTTKLPTTTSQTCMPTRNCSYMEGQCQREQQCPDKYEEIHDGCEGMDCHCCVPACVTTRNCSYYGGQCQREQQCPANTEEIHDGCEGMGCHCCVPEWSTKSSETWKGLRPIWMMSLSCRTAGRIISAVYRLSCDG